MGDEDSVINVITMMLAQSQESIIQVLQAEKNEVNEQIKAKINILEEQRKNLVKAKDQRDKIRRNRAEALKTLSIVGIFNSVAEQYGVEKSSDDDEFKRHDFEINKKIDEADKAITRFNIALYKIAQLILFQTQTADLIKTGNLIELNKLILSKIELIRYFIRSTFSFEKMAQEYILQHFSFKNSYFEKDQVGSLIEFDKYTRIKSLVLDNIDLRDTGFAEFLRFLSNPLNQIEQLSLRYCHLNSSQIYNLFQAITNSKTLAHIDLNGNRINQNCFAAIIKLIPRSLKKLSLRDNYIEYVDVPEAHTNLKTTFTFLPHGQLDQPLPLGLEIDLAGNFIESNTHNKTLKKLLISIMIKFDGLLEDLLFANFDKIIKIDGKDEYLLSFILKGDRKYGIRFNYQEALCTQEVKKSIHVITDDEVFICLLSIRNNAELLAKVNLKRSLYGRSKLDKDVIQIAKKLLDYHEHAPLKSHIRIHTFLRSPHLSSIECLLLSNHVITPHIWMVYIIASKPRNGEVFSQHAMLAYEGLTKHGQRFFHIAHLSAPVRGVPAIFKNMINGQVQPIISHFKKNTLEETIKAVKDHSYIASFRVERHKVKALHQQVLQDMYKFDYKFKTIIPSWNGRNISEEEKTAVNCIKWAVNRIETNLQINIPKEIKGHYIPSEVVANIKAQGEPINLIKLNESPIQDDFKDELAMVKSLENSALSSQNLLITSVFEEEKVAPDNDGSTIIQLP